MNKHTVFVPRHFNVLHPGHIRLLRFAKDYGARLIVAIESDRLAGIDAHVPEHLRLEGADSKVKCNSDQSSKVCPCTTHHPNAINSLSPENA